MREAVARFVPDGASVCLNTAIEALIPFAAGHELIRQRRRNLTLIGPISDMLFDQLVGAGCVRQIVAAWVGNVSAGLGHNYRRAVEQGVPGPVEVQDHSNLTLAFGLKAAALVHERVFGRMAALQGDEIVDVALEEATRELKRVPQAILDAARALA